MTHTYAILEVSKQAYDEIKSLLAKAGYDHAFHDNVIDMHGIALQAGKPKHEWRFYMNGTFCGRCNEPIGTSKECI